MKRLVFAGAVAFGVLSFPNIAAADIVPSQETTCVEFEQVSVSSWVNPFEFAATVTLNGNLSFTVPAFSTVERTDPWVATSVPYTVTFAGVDGYVQEGVLDTPTLYDGCGIPATSTTFVPPTSTVVDLPPVTTTAPSDPAHPATPIIDRSVNTCGSQWERPEDCIDQSTETVELAFTGADPALLALIGAYLVAAGGIAVTWARSRRS